MYSRTCWQTSGLRSPGRCCPLNRRVTLLFQAISHVDTNPPTHSRGIGMVWVNWIKWKPSTWFICIASRICHVYQRGPQMRKHKIKVITYAWQIWCKVQSCRSSQQFCIYHFIKQRQCQCSGLRRGLGTLAANDSVRCRHPSLSYLQACQVGPPRSTVGRANSSLSARHKLLLDLPGSTFASLLTAHCAVTQIAWKSIILEIEIDVFLTVRQKCFEACLILLSTLMLLPHSFLKPRLCFKQKAPCFAK